MNKLLALPVLVIVAILLTSQYVSAVTFTQKDNEAKEEIFSSLTNNVNSSFSQYKTVIAITHDNRSTVIYNQSEAPPIVIPPPVINNTQPPTCPVNQFYNTTSKQCEDVPVIPPPPQPTTDRPDPNFNHTLSLRIGTVGDIDNNNGLVTQLNLMKKYNVQVLIIVGDYGYDSCPAVIDKIKAAGFDSKNAIIIQGNHDCSSNTKAFNGGWSTLYGDKFFSDAKFAVFAIDGNSAFDCSSTQYKAMKDKLDSSDAWYNIPVIHQPFVTEKGRDAHGPNGQFNCWDPLFRENGINMVLQAHNHNYQRFDINGIYYMVVGIGTHDTGSSMYGLDGNGWNGFDCLKCITGTNGVTLIDLQIDDPHIRHMQGWFISNSDSVKDSFSR